MHRWNIRYPKEITLIIYARIQSLIKSLRDTMLGYAWCQNDIPEKPFPVKLDILTTNVAKLKCEMDLKWERENVRWIMWNVKLNSYGILDIKWEMCYGKWSFNFNLKLEMGNLKQELWQWNWIVTLKLKCDIGIEMWKLTWNGKCEFGYAMWHWKHEIV